MASGVVTVGTAVVLGLRFLVGCSWGMLKIGAAFISTSAKKEVGIWAWLCIWADPAYSWVISSEASVVTRAA